MSLRSSLLNLLEVLMALQGELETGIGSGSGTPSDPPEDHTEELSDFDDSANALWNIYRKGAKSHDEARMQTLRDDMDGLLIFVCIRYQPMTGWSS